ncbi:hypothetical protein PInf_007936 [Phytophthora infestans]|nr:hypothetical protein PInf_007936 [Phytophthora infestans]
MDAALISIKQLCVAFALTNLSGRAKSWVYTREATSPGCFTSWAQLSEQLRAAFLPANDEYRHRSRFLSCKQGRRELHEYVQAIREPTVSLVGNPLNEHIKVTVLMDGLRVGPARTQLFRPSSGAHAGLSMTRESVSNPGRASTTGPVPMELGSAEQRDYRFFGSGKRGHFKRDCPAQRHRRRTFPKPVLKGHLQKPGSRGQGNVGDHSGISGPVRVQALVASIITAGSIVTKGKQCSAEYAQLAEQHAGECAKTFEEYEADMERYKILRDVGETGLPQKGDEREDTGLYFRY